MGSKQTWEEQEQHLFYFEVSLAPREHYGGMRRREHYGTVGLVNTDAWEFAWHYTCFTSICLLHS